MTRPLLFAFGQLGAALVGAQTPICLIQGSGTVSPFSGQVVTTTGVITAVFAGSGTMQGFYLEDPSCDADANTSNGIFVYDPFPTGIIIGDRVNVTGSVQEFQNLTELYAVSNITLIGSGTVLPTEITLPVASLTTWERYEGMLLRFPQELVVTSNEDWVRYGELILGPERIWQATHTTDPNDADPDGVTSNGSTNVAAIANATGLGQRSVIILDDGRVSSYPDPPPMIGANGTLRCGSTVSQLTGVLHYGYGDYRLEPVGVVQLLKAARPALPDVGGNVRIASYNVHNYWSTLGGFGAANSAELNRQRTKLTAALHAMDADVFVLCELEDNDAAWQDLLDALNASYGDLVYAGLERDEGFGTKSVFFYKPATLSPVGGLYWLYTSTFERVHITQGFEVNATNGQFLLSSMHPRSKLCDNATGANLDQGDGQGCYNDRRRQQAQALLDHWASVRSNTGIEAQLIMGDFNAYFQEDPLDLMRSNGLVALVPDDELNYTYRFGASFGALDHAFGTMALADALTGARPWAINADEPPALDYPDENIDFYQPNEFRSSDHDPLLVGLASDALVLGVAEERPEAISFHMDARAGTARWEGEGIVYIEVLDVLGHVLTTLPQDQRSGDLSILSTGFYLWRCAMGSGRPSISGRFVIQ